MGRRYLLAMSAGAVAVACATAALTWLVDPLGIYASPRVEGFNTVKPALKTRSRIFKTVNVAAGGWEVLVIGTSRAETGFDCGHRSFRGMRCFNAALSGQHYEESLALVRAAARSGTLRRVVAVLDFEVANAYYEGPADFTPANYRPWRKVSLAFNAEIARQALLTPMRQDAASALKDASVWFADGRFAFPPLEHGHRAATVASEAAYLERNLAGGPGRRGYVLAAGALRPLDHVRDLFALAHATGIEVVIVIGPAHARQLEVIAASGLWDTWEQWKRSLVVLNEAAALAARRPAFTAWDFSGHNDATTEPFPPPGDPAPMRWYYESSHFRPRLGDRVLERIAGAKDPGFGETLTAAGIESHLRAAREARASWRRHHRADAEEIALLARQAASVAGGKP